MLKMFENIFINKVVFPNEIIGNEKGVHKALQ